MKRARRVLVVGIDGAVRKLIDQHIAEGICPNFKRVFENGVKSLNSLCPMPTITPPNWTTISTGCYPITHQITDYWRHVPGTSPNASSGAQLISPGFSVYPSSTTIFIAYILPSKYKVNHI